MVKYHIDNSLTQHVKVSSRFHHLTKEDHMRLYSEIKNAVLQGIDEKLVSLHGTFGIENKVQSLLLWVLGIAKEDEKPTGSQKIKSPGSYCDIDLDFSQEKRDQVFDYLAEKYGTNRFGKIATFGTMGAKASIRNSARSLGYSVELQNKVAKFIPELPGVTIQDSIDNNKDFQELIIKDSEVKHIIDVARKLEGLPNALSVHASACIISDISATDHIPMMLSAKKDNAKVVTQYDMKDVENAGLLKYDILGLKNLDIINETVKLIKKNRNINIDISSIDVNDPGIYKLLNDGYVTAIFQFDGSAAVYLPQLKPENINEISDITSIIRPGPMAMGMIDQYIRAKFKNEKFNYNLKDQKLIDKVWSICNTSYGLLIYQEQVIKCFTDIGEFDEIAGDNARRAMGKKLPEEMAKLKDKFSSGGVKNGYSKEDLEILYDQMAGFAEYGFNKSHSICYSVITCQTAYLSYYYPLEFFTAAMTIDSGKTDEVRHYIKALKDRGFEILPPDINKSETGFTIEEKGIRFGLNAIKGVGASVSKKILGRKPKSGYKSLGHFIRRNIDLLNSKVLESYTKGGCFKSFGYNKESIVESIPYILEFLGIYKEANKYNTIFDLCNISLDDYIENCIIKISNKEDNLFYEIESLGLYISKHPLDDYELKTKYNGLAVNKISYTQYFEDGEDFITIGSVSGILVKKTKAKLNMAIFNILDSESGMGAIMFPKTYSKYLNDTLLSEGKVLVFIGKLKKSETGIELIVNDLLDEADKYLVKKKVNKNEFIINKKLRFILE